MLLISQFFNGETDRRGYRAPKGHLWLINAYVVNVFNSASVRIIALGRKLAFDHPTPLGDKEAYLFSIDHEPGHFLSPGINLDEKMKWITIGPKDFVASSCSIQIFGEIIKASRIELIIEWFRNRR